jgi:hypothetical protein
MKIIEIMVLLASLFAIAGTAFFQLLVLLTNMLFAQQANWKIKLKINIQPTGEEARCATRGSSLTAFKRPTSIA